MDERKHFPERTGDPIHSTIGKIARVVIEMSHKIDQMENSLKQIQQEFQTSRSQSETFINILSQQHQNETSRLLDVVSMLRTDNPISKTGPTRVQYTEPEVVQQQLLQQQHIQQQLQQLYFQQQVANFNYAQRLAQPQMNPQHVSQMPANQMQGMVPAVNNALNLSSFPVPHVTVQNRTPISNVAKTTASSMFPIPTTVEQNRPAIDASNLPGGQQIANRGQTAPRATNTQNTTSLFPKSMPLQTNVASSPGQNIANTVTSGSMFTFGDLFNKQFATSSPQSKPAVTTVSTTQAKPAFDFSQASTGIGVTRAVTATTTVAQTYPFKFSSFTFEAPKNTSLTKEADDGEDETPEHFEPSAHFEPVVPLPDLVDVKTGEEEEKVLFVEHCKLYRYDKTLNEWKERGIGKLKILQDLKDNACRIVMRRDQIHKLCANHKITPLMSLVPMAGSDRSFAWFAQDFSEGELSEENLAVRFKSSDVAKQFEEIVDSCKTVAEKKPTIPPKKEENAEKGDKKDAPSGKIGFGDVYKVPEGSWECDGCLVRNNAQSKICACCSTERKSKDGTNGATAIPRKPTSTVAPIKSPEFSFGFKPATTSASTTVPSTQQTNVSMKFASFSFKQDAPSLSAKTTQDGSQQQSSFSSLFSKSGPPSAPQQSMFSTQSSQETPKPVQFSFSLKDSTGPVAVTTSKSSDSSSLTGLATSSSATTKSEGGFSLFGGSSFSVKTADPAKTSAKGIDFSLTPKTQVSSPATLSKPAVVSPESVKASGQPLFGGSSEGFFKSSGSSFAALAAKAPNSSSFASAKDSSFSSVKFNVNDSSIFSQFRTSLPDKKKDSASLNKSAIDHESDEEREEFEPDVHFEPVIPLPSLVDSKTGEEGEELLFKERCKLFRLVKENNEYKERGLGDIKILYNKMSNKYRMVMRREQVLKVCLNALITPEMKIQKKSNMPETACSWICLDYSEGNEEGVMECFAAKFKESSLTDGFMRVFEAAVVGKKLCMIEKSDNGKSEAEAEEIIERVNIGTPDSSEAAEEGDNEFDELASYVAKFTVISIYSSPLSKNKPEEFTASFVIASQEIDGDDIFFAYVLKENELFDSYEIEGDGFEKLNSKSIQYVNTASNRKIRADFDTSEICDEVASIMKKTRAHSDK